MLKTIWFCMLIVGFLLLIVSIILVFLLHIPDLLDELSGMKAKRQIRRLRELNIGTGSFDNLSTNEIYSVISSGSLLSDEITIIEEEVPKGSISNINYSSTVEEDDISTSDMSEEDVTGYISKDGLDEGTSYMDDESTGMLSKIEEYCLNKKDIVVLEEYSSLRREN